MASTRSKKRTKPHTEQSQFLTAKKETTQESDQPFFKSANNKDKAQSGDPSIISSDDLPTLYYGSQGVKVQYLQQRLNMFSAGLVVDGIFGPKTHQAVKQFQAVFATPVDGIVGPITWKALNKTNNQKPDENNPGEVVDQDYIQLAQNLIGTKESISQEDPIAHAMFGGILQQTATNLSQMGNGGAFQTIGFVPQSVPANTTATLTADVLNAQLDILLKSIAFAVGFSDLGAANSNDSLLSQKVVVLTQIEQQVSTQGLSPLPQSEVDLFLKRVRLMRDFYDSLLKNKGTSPNPEIEKQNPITGTHMAQRQQLIALALSDVGKVRSKDTPDRYGAKHLQQIYDVALNKDHNFEPKHFEKYSEVEGCADGDTLCVTTNKQQHSLPLVNRDVLGSWCGIGALYWLKINGQSDLVWKNGVTVLSNILKFRPFNELPKVGDVVIKRKEQHHGIITWIDPDAKTPKGKTEWSKISIKTVESNIDDGQIVHAPGGHDTLGYFDEGAFNSFERK